MAKKNSRWAVNLTALVLAAGLLMGCPQKVNEKPQEASKYNYKVEHLQQNIADNDYTLYETETLSGKDGETTSAAAKTYVGFTVQSFSQAAIKTDGSTVVQIKYNRNIIALKLNLNGGTTTTPLTDGEGGIKLLKGKFGAKVELENLKKGSDILDVWTPELPSTFPALPAETYTASWTDKYRITVKGDERINIPSDSIKIDPTPDKTWNDIKTQIEGDVSLKPEWQGGDYKIYEWRLGGETGEKISADYPIDKHLTVYAVTNYATFNIIGNKIELTSDGKGYTGDKPKGKIIIHDDITEIEDGPESDKGAFKDCTEISSIKFPQALTKIGENAFEGCTGLKSLDLSDCTSLTTIGAAAFSGCKGLTSLDLSACTSLTTIDSGAFRGCTGLRSISLPTNLTQIGWYAFSGCTSLTSLTIDSANTKYKTEGNILYSKDGETLIFAAGGLTSANIPDTVTTIGAAAFSGCKGLTSITLPASLTTIGELAFYGCTGLTSITLPASLTTIGNVAFHNCTGLTSITLPANLTQIGWGAFRGCTGLISITLPASITKIDSNAFRGCTGLTSITLPANLTQIGWGAFGGCTGLTSVHLPARITRIYGSAFEGCTGLTSADFADTNGWKVYANYDYSGTSTPISSSDLVDTSKAAKYLRDTYADKYWKKN